MKVRTHAKVQSGLSRLDRLKAMRRARLIYFKPWIMQHDFDKALSASNLRIASLIEQGHLS